MQWNIVISQKPYCVKQFCAITLLQKISISLTFHLEQRGVWNTYTMHVFHTLKYSRLVTGCETSECCWGLAVWDASERHPPNKSPRGAISKAVTPTQPGPLMQTGMECVRQGSGGSGVHGSTTLIKKMRLQHGLAATKEHSCQNLSPTSECVSMCVWSNSPKNKPIAVPLSDLIDF